MCMPSAFVFFPGWLTSILFIFFPLGQRILQYKSDVLQTVVLVNPVEDTATSEVRHNDAVHLC